MQAKAYDIFKLLVDSGASIDLQGPLGYTPLFYSIIAGDINFIKILLDGSADLSLKFALSKESSFEYSALELAAVYASKDIVDLLITFGADVGIAHFIAQKNGRSEDILDLLKANSSPKYK